MPLTQFVEDHPGCAIERPDPTIPALVLGALGAGIASSLGLAIYAVGQGRLGWLAVALAALALAVRPFWRWLAHAQRVCALRRRGHACFAISEHDLLLVDAVGNAVVVALDRVVALEIDGDEARLRTDADEQGIIYAILFQLFDESVPGPSAQRFFDALAPRLRASCPLARIVRKERGIGALTI
jgi:hypothetical protein